jgi:hypothetical protein
MVSLPKGIRIAGVVEVASHDRIYPAANRLQPHLATEIGITNEA